MKKFLKKTVMMIAMLLVSVAAWSQVVINGNNVVIRSTPAISTTNKLAHANKGATFAYLGDTGSFYCINYNGTKAYVHKSYSYLKQSQPVQQPQASSSQFVVIDGNNVRIRTSPSLSDNNICGKADKGNFFAYAGYVNGWYKIKYGGAIRYVKSDFAHIR